MQLERRRIALTSAGVILAAGLVFMVVNVVERVTAEDAASAEPAAEQPPNDQAQSRRGRAGGDRAARLQRVKEYLISTGELEEGLSEDETRAAVRVIMQDPARRRAIREQLGFGRRGQGGPDDDRRARNEQRMMQRGIQVGDVLPELTVHALQVDEEEDAQPSTLVLPEEKPTLIMTASLTCPVARRRIAQLDQIHQQFGDQIHAVVLYTIEAHPKGDPAPNRGEEWVTTPNEQQGILHRQPTTVDERRELAARFVELTGTAVPIVLDNMDNTGWETIGRAPNAAILLRPDGAVAAKHGWFDGPTMIESITAALNEDQPQMNAEEN